MVISFIKNAAFLAAFQFLQLFAFFCAFTLLISNTAACFTSRLARCLAFTAAAVFSTVTKIASFKCFDVFHDTYLHKIVFTIIPLLYFQVNRVFSLLRNYNEKIFIIKIYCSFYKKILIFLYKFAFLW